MSEKVLSWQWGSFFYIWSAFTLLVTMRHIFATKAGEPRNKILTYLGWVVLLMLLVVLVGQGKLLVVPQEGVSNSLLIWVSVLMFFELQSIPFVLGMKVSPGLRVVSMWSGRLVSASLLVIAMFVGWRFVLYTVLFAALIGLITRNRRPKADFDRKRVRKEQEKIFKETYGLK